MVGAKHARITCVAGQPVAFVDGGQIECVPALDLRADRKTYRRRDGSHEQLAAAEHEFFGGATTRVRVAFIVGKTGFHLAAADTALGVDLVDRKCDAALHFFA